MTPQSGTLAGGATVELTVRPDWDAAKLATVGLVARGALFFKVFTPVQLQADTTLLTLRPLSEGQYASCFGATVSQLQLVPGYVAGETVAVALSGPVVVLSVGVAVLGAWVSLVISES